MLSFTSVQLDAWIAAFFWPFFRILALVASAPFFGARGIPASAKVALAFVLTILVSPMLAPMPAVAPASVQGILILIHQLLIGVAMGLAMRVVFSAVEMAGHVIGLQMGLGFATFFDPQNSAQIPVMGQFMGLIAMLLFLAINGHLLVLQALMESFQMLPVGLLEISSKGWYTLALWGGEIFRAGLWIALPVLAVLMMINIALAVLTRAAPQLNIFVVGFPLTLAVGFIALSFSISYFLPQFSAMIEHAMQVLMKILADTHPT